MMSDMELMTGIPQISLVGVVLIKLWPTIKRKDEKTVALCFLDEKNNGLAGA